ncbi:hypothetical protein V866_006922 [Kwoniella sp. B9012]
MFGLERITKHYTVQLALCSGLLTLSSANYAFDNQGMAQTQAMNPFIRQFGEYNPKTKSYAIPAYFLSLMNSLVFIGFAFGIWIGSMISARYGRRMTVFTMSLWAICSATIIITARTKEHMLISRILNYIYIGMELSVIPVFQSEIMPAPVRGFAVGSYQFSLSIGGLIINCICRGTSTLKSNAAWRIPYGFYYIVPAIIASPVWFIPESPRWLLSQDRREEAKISLRRLRVGKTDLGLEEEINSILLSLEAEKDKGTYTDLFRGTNLRRTLIVMGSNFFLQATGQSFASAYGTIFIKSLNTVNPFNMAVTNSALGILACAAAMIMVDKFGRRPLMILGAFGQFTFLIVMASLGTFKRQTNQSKSVIVAMTSLNGLAFAVAWAPLNYIISSELPAQKLRDKTQRVGSWVNVFTNFVVAFTLPYLLNAPYANLSSKVGYIYGPLALCASVFAYLCIPECKGRSLEEVDQLFFHKISARRSAQWEAPTIIPDLSQHAKDQQEGRAIDNLTEKDEDQYADANPVLQKV